MKKIISFFALCFHSLQFVFFAFMFCVVFLISLVERVFYYAWQFIYLVGSVGFTTWALIVEYQTNPFNAIRLCIANSEIVANICTPFLIGLIFAFMFRLLMNILSYKFYGHEARPFEFFANYACDMKATAKYLRLCKIPTDIDGIKYGTKRQKENLKRAEELSEMEAFKKQLDNM